MGEIVQRAWGTYEVLAESERYKVKRLIMEPGKSFSRQYHNHRSEHWTVVHGCAEILLGESFGPYYENNSVMIPMGTWHQLSNPGKLPVAVIEVQYGSYLGEDDIVRAET